MYLPERLKAYPMKTLYSGVLLAMVITLSLSFLLFHAIANRVQRKSIDPAFERIDELNWRVRVEHWRAAARRR